MIATALYLLIVLYIAEMIFVMGLKNRIGELQKDVSVLYQDYLIRKIAARGEDHGKK